MTARHPQAEDPDLHEVTVPVVTVWSSPEAEEAVTQLLLGEPVRVVRQAGGWAEVRAPWQPSVLAEDGYPGWVRRTALGTPAPSSDGTACVTRPSATCRSDSGTGIEVSFGTVLGTEAADEQTVGVLLPDGRRGKLPRDAVVLRGNDRHAAPSAEDVLATSRQFLDVPYLWGGTSGWGVDCSGLVHLVFRRYGIQVPRDAGDQATAAVPVPLGHEQRGDLYFFARPGRAIHHVGVVSAPVTTDGVRTMLHAPETGALVEEASIATDRLDTLVAAVRVLAPDRTG